MPATRPVPQAQGSRAQRFAAYIRPAVVARGYDIDSPRGGGKKELAEAVGMSQSSVGRMLAGQTLPDPVFLERLANVLGLSFMELLVRSGLASRKSADDEPQASRPEPPLTPETAARRLGIRNPDRVQVFTTMTKTLVEQEKADKDVRAGGD